MADAVISVVVERAAAVLEEKIVRKVNLVRGAQKEVHSLSKKLDTIKDVLDDAEKRGVEEQSVKKWLRKLEDTAYEMDDILDEWNYALLKHKMKRRVTASAKQKKVAVRRDTAKKIENVKEALDQILKEKADFNFVISLPETDRVPKSWRVQSTSSPQLKVYGSNIYGNVFEIVSKLMLNDDSHLVVSIVGMGGIGKTTLAQLVYNDPRVKDCFDLRIWICVSDPFDVSGIARGIVESVTKESVSPNTNQLELLLEKLGECISEKKFLLVLDDVWTERSEDWEPLSNILKHGAPGSKVMATTRKEGVAKMMGTFDDDIYRPRHLSDEECWSLLRCISHSGRSEEECGKFEDVGKEIARKCRGLPLAAKVLGGLLQCKRSLEDWENVLKSEIWSLEKAEKELFPHLLLSYNELSPSLKRCFSYCSVYPKDFRISVGRLIEEWMALGYLGSVGGDGGAEVKGLDYFNQLAMRSLFQDLEERSGDPEERTEWCKMHDIVHDFALFLRKNADDIDRGEMTRRSCQICNPSLLSRARVYRSLVWTEDSPQNLCDCLTTLRVLSFDAGWHRRFSPPRGMEKLVHLRWLGLSRTRVSKGRLKLICRLYFLQTLLLDYCSLREIPDEIGNLVQLRHLDLTYNVRLKELPESMCSLVELRILNIGECWNLHRLPEEIHSLQNLQHLPIERTPARHRLPRGVGQLSGLRTLSSDFHAGRGYNNLGLLKNLSRLTGSLQLFIHTAGTTCSSDLKEFAEEARQAELRNKVHIHTLSIEFVDEEQTLSLSPSMSPSLMVGVIEALEPNKKLRELQIKGYNGSGFPHWISSPFNLVNEIYLDDMIELSSLPPMGKLPLLEVLFIRRMAALKVVGREFLGIGSSSSSSSPSSSASVAFPKLRKLTFRDLHKLSEWEDITAEEEDSAAVGIMPCLTMLCIHQCGDLKKLPHRLLRKASSLRILAIVDSSELQKIYGGNDWRSFIGC